MSNYSLVIDSTFKPFSYQELMAPVTRMSDYHEKLAQEYDTLSSQADILEAMGKDDRDKESGAYSRYKAYSDSLRKEADDLYRYGLNVESRRRLSDIRRRYNTDIVPIQNAWNKRQEEVKAQQDLMDKNPGVMFTRDANQTSIDAYIDNPMGGYQTINPDNIYKDMYTAAKSLEKQIREGHLEGIDPYTAQYITTYGLKPDLIADWIADPSKNKTLTAMMEQVLRKNGITAEALQNSPNLDRIMQASTNAAQLGAWGAVGEDRGQIMELFGPRQDRRDASEINNYIRKKNIDAAQNASVSNNNINPLPLRSTTGDKNADTYHSTEYDRQLNSSYGKNYMNQLWSAARRDGDKRVLDVVEYDGEKGWKTVDSLNSNDLKGYTVTNVRYSKYGNTAILQKDGEEPIRVKIPVGINIAAEGNVSSAIANADEFNAVLRKGLRPKTTSDGTALLKDSKGNIQYTNEALTPEDRALISRYQREALNEMGSYGSQIVLPSETDNETYKPFAF